MEAGAIQLHAATGPKTIEVASLPEATEVAGPWEVAFPPQGGAPEKTTFDQLVSWPQHADPGVKYFSGVATYTRILSRAVREQSAELTACTWIWARLR